MKIFNWVHRKFQQKEEDVRRDVKKAELVKNDVATDTLALLEHIPLVNVLDGWNDGLLSIGTLGFVPLKDFGSDHFKQENEHFDEEQEKYSTNYYYHHNEEVLGNEEILGEEEDHEFQFEIYEEGEIEMDPLVFNAFKHGFDSNFKANACEGRHDLDHFTGNDDKVGSNLEYESEREKKGERTTLADLFSADSHHMNCKKTCDGQGMKVDLKPNIDSFKKISADCHVKKGVSFFEKAIPHAKEGSRPIKKIHKLLTKMLKRKIHPDLQSKETQLGVVNKEGHGGTEYLSLLQTQAVAT